MGELFSSTLNLPARPLKKNMSIPTQIQRVAAAMYPVTVAVLLPWIVIKYLKEKKMTPARTAKRSRG
jgi:hypothetical protein